MFNIFHAFSLNFVRHSLAVRKVSCSGRTQAFISSIRLVASIYSFSFITSVALPAARQQFILLPSLLLCCAECTAADSDRCVCILRSDAIEVEVYQGYIAIHGVSNSIVRVWSIHSLITSSVTQYPNCHCQYRTRINARVCAYILTTRRSSTRNFRCCIVIVSAELWCWCIL